MNGRSGRTQRGFLLLPVVLALALIGSVAFLLSREGAMHVRRAATEVGIDRARYVAEAGLEHQRWRANASACTGYTDLGATDFGPHSYSATITPTDGSPVTVTATGELADGTRRTARKAEVTVFDAPRTVILQPGRITGKDTYLNAAQPDTNYGADAELVIDPAGPPGEERRSLLQFDLSGLASGAVIDSAELGAHLYQNVGEPATVEVHRVTRDWVEGTGAANSGATWQEYDGASSWTTSGGDYATGVIDSYSASSTGWKTLDVSSVVQGWVDGTYANQGLILAAQPSDGNKVKRHHSSDSAQCALRPKLTLTYRCECGACDFPPPPAPICSADYVDVEEGASFSTADVGASDVWGLGFLHDCTTFNGVTAPVGGAWLLVDTSNKSFYMTDTAGALLTSLATPKDDMLDVAYVHAGAWRDHLAVTEGSEMRVYFLDSAGAVQDFFPTGGFTEHPVGVTYIGRTASGAYQNHLAISSDKDGFGASIARVYIVDQAGSLRRSIDLSGVMSEPWGIAHVSGTDRLLVARKDGLVFLIDFDGNVIGQYASDGTQVQGIAVNPLTCEHVVNEKDEEEIVYFHNDT